MPRRRVLRPHGWQSPRDVRLPSLLRHALCVGQARRRPQRLHLIIAPRDQALLILATGALLPATLHHGPDRQDHESDWRGDHHAEQRCTKGRITAACDTETAANPPKRMVKGMPAIAANSFPMLVG
ncbi:hypothetical protein FHT40_006124 [Mycolicibacterium sp. BK556]|uniref:hypothetical protein n=1 Tax=unclassified Mycolicibacterium TaxID=2636767 RepID=UPI0017F5BD0C|nr:MULTISPECIES: hypothetical protein [unclassified Mycolicibacterium]MBB3606433.1 hypothetical protein [Mycolicibacterium sp. BK556]MBB3636321.1 hypothetical protein [Mycolicibacterium sp. BK607]